MVEPERPQKVVRRRVACRISNATLAQAQANSRALKPTQTRTHTRTEKCNIFAFPRQQYFRESISILRYTYISHLVTAP